MPDLRRIATCVVTAMLASACGLSDSSDPADPDDDLSSVDQQLGGNGGGDGRNSNLEVPLVLVLWEHDNWNGHKREFVIDDPNLGWGWTSGAICQSGAVFDNMASSVGVHPGPDYQRWKDEHNGAEPTVTLYTEPYYGSNGGYYVILTKGGYAHLSDFDMNDKVSSIRFNDAINTPPQFYKWSAGGAATISPIKTVLRIHTATRNQVANGYCGAADNMMQLVESSTSIYDMYGSVFNDSAQWIEVLRGPNYTGYDPVWYYDGLNYSGHADGWYSYVRDVDFTTWENGILDNRVSSVQLY